jgi:hypothetical protein
MAPRVDVSPGFPSSHPGRLPVYAPSCLGAGADRKKTGMLLTAGMHVLSCLADSWSNSITRRVWRRWICHQEVQKLFGLSFADLNRDRGKPRGYSPPTPPYMRVT